MRGGRTVTERLQKILSARGMASRRKAEELIRAGQVSVNGVPASLGDSADPETDDIRVAGQPLAARGNCCANGGRTRRSAHTACFRSLL